MINLCYMVKMSTSYVTSIKYFKTLNSAVAKCNVNNSCTRARSNKNAESSIQDDVRAIRPREWPTENLDVGCYGAERLMQPWEKQITAGEAEILTRKHAWLAENAWPLSIFFFVKKRLNDYNINKWAMCFNKIYRKKFIFILYNINLEDVF